MNSDNEIGLLIDRLRRVGMKARDLPHHAKMHRASVLVPLFLRRGSVPHMLFTQRPMSLRTHAGEVCFPGGKQDVEDDLDDLKTALREAKEEVGIQPHEVQPLCRLVPIESVTGLCVTPIVGYIQNSDAMEPSKMKLSENEVEAAFCVPVSYFLVESNCVSKVEVEWSGGTFVNRTYLYQNECGRTFKIWGLTAHVAHQAAEIMGLSTATTKLLSTTTLLAQEAEKKESAIAISGHLFRLKQSKVRPHWVRHYFVCSGHMLHEYVSEREATRKSASATKKNRLQLKGCQVILPPKEDRKEDSHRCPFTVYALDGRIKWHLAAQGEDERQYWKRAIEHFSS